MQWRSRKELQSSSKPACHQSRWVVARFFDQSKSRISADFRRTGKRYEPPGCVGQFEPFRRSRSSGQRAPGSVRRCKVSVQITENELQRCRLLFKPRKIFVRFSDIRLFANIRTIRFNPTPVTAALSMGVRREVLRGVHQIQLGVWGALWAPSGVRGGAPEDFEINAFQRLRTPVSLSFLSRCCYTKIHAFFFIHTSSHPHHFQLNEVVPNHTLWYQKANVKRIAQFWVLFFTCTMRLVGVLNFGNSSSLWSKAKRSCSQSTSYPHALSASPTVGSTACTCVLDSLYSPWDDALLHWVMPLSAAGRLWEICCINDTFPATRAECSKTGPKCSTSGEWDPYPATQAAKASFAASLHHFRSQATKRTRRRTPWMSELSSRLLKALLSKSLPYP